jgi:hypothetical protein
MELKHVSYVHPVDVISAEDADRVRPTVLYVVQVLIDRIRASLVPGIPSAHLRGDRIYELVKNVRKVPAELQMSQEGIGFELGKYDNSMEPRVYEVRQNEVDDAVMATERDGGFRPLVRERSQTLPLTSSQDDRKAICHGLNGP